MSWVNGKDVQILLLGNPGEEHVGFHLLCGAIDRGLSASLLDTTKAYDGSWVVRQLSWRVRGRRPARISAFCEETVAAAAAQSADVVLTTGIAPVDASALLMLRERGVRLANFLTDDPFNPAHYAGWFLETLPYYDVVYSPRFANMSELRAAGCRDVRYMPFGYNPRVHFPEPVSTVDRSDLESDVVFAGGADADRMPWIEAMIGEGYVVGLYGGYWDRYPATRHAARGIAGLATIRRAVASAKVALCIVRQANRDAHAMRTYELAAMRACMLVQRTRDHESLFGPDGTAAVYFDSMSDMLEKLAWLSANPGERTRLADAAHAVVTRGAHTYADRLSAILASAFERAS